MAPSLRPSPSATMTSRTRPVCFLFSSQEISSWSATRRMYRSWTTSLGICPSISAAGVPGRLEYWKVNAWAKRASRTVCRVCWKSSSVSPGKPTMMSVVIAASGMAARTFSMMERNRSWRYERRIARSTVSEPDWSGMCSCGMTLGVSAIAAITSSVKSRGCGEVKRTRSRPSIFPQARSSLENAWRSPMSLP